MPRYDYRCKEHGWFEAAKGFEDASADCSICGKPAPRAPVSGIPAANTPTVGFQPSREIVRG